MKAFITGITGQDGSYLAQLLLSKGYEVHGLIRRASYPNTRHLDAIFADSPTLPVLHYGDLTDGTALNQLLDEIQPDEVYNLAAQTFVHTAVALPKYTIGVNYIAVSMLLDAVRHCEAKRGKRIKVYQASSSEMFGSSPLPHDETTKFHPCNPYAVTKCAAHLLCQNYRESYGMFICAGIQYNHESPRRGDCFVVRKITKGLAQIKAGLQKELKLGNLDAQRDWGYAKDFVLAMWLMLQQDQPQDYIIGTGETHSVREVLAVAAKHLGMNWEEHVVLDQANLRPSDVIFPPADNSKARKMLGWAPSVTFEQLIQLMVEHDYDLAQRKGQ